jgi:Do/DeqQ family serine protease
MQPNPIIRPRSYYIGAAALVITGMVLGLGLSAGLGIQRDSGAQSTRTALPQAASSSALPESPFVQVVDRSLPAVVFIQVRKKAGAGDAPDDMFHRLFGQDAPRRQQRTPSSGSGFVVDAKGHILTNNHVVANAEDITVTLNDRREFKAKVVGTDPQTDVAVIKIEGSNLPVLPLGDSDKIRIGDWAIAIGNPLGELRGSVTVGIISARGRSNLNIFGSNDLRFQDFIQTDASINFGNSGGPLCNIRGEVIGINTAINTSGQGIGFAIPINLARHVGDQLIATGSVRRAMMGVELDDLTPELAESFGIAGTEGVVIRRVLPGSPAEKAGIQRGDVVVEFDGQSYNDMQKLRLRVADTQVGRKVPVTIVRDGKRMQLTITLVDRDENVLAGSVPRTGDAVDESAMGGLAVRDLRAEERRQLNVESGVLVTGVEDGSPAEDKGIQANDVVEEVNGAAVTDAESFARLMSDAKKSGRPARLFVSRGGVGQYLPLRLLK